MTRALLLIPLPACFLAAWAGYGEEYPLVWWTAAGVSLFAFLKGLDLMRGE